MRIKTNRLKILLVALLCCFGLIASLAMPLSMNASAYSHYCNGENECHEIIDYDSDLCSVTEGQPVEDCHQEQYGQAAFSQNIGIQPTAVQNVNSCNTHSVDCGSGREEGYSSTFLSDGCRNWIGWSYTYGATDIPFWLNMATFNTIANVSHRNILIDDLRTQAEMWNQAVMHDGTGQIVRLYEVGTDSSTLPANINGKKVVEFKREDGNYSGEFQGSSAPILRINYDTTRLGTRPGRKVDTPAHEMGHLLGLGDLDTASSRIHNVLMGYGRETAEADIGEAITYQDIQGIAVLNKKHTTHTWNRYVVSGNNYLHFCFYCDTVDSVTSAKSGSSAMVEAAACAHNYQPMVSCGDRHWHKCIDCYKVVESPFLLQSVINSDDTITIEITGQADDRAAVEIPSQIGGQKVTHIGSGAFSGRANITTVTFKAPSNIKIIGSNAFSDCTEFSQITIPSSVTSIGEGSFSGCTSLSQITIPSTVREIGAEAFEGCSNMNKVTFSSPSQLHTIGNSAFKGCTSLLGINIPITVTRIEAKAFMDCTSLTSVTLSTNRYYTTINEGLFLNCTNLAAIKIPDNITTIGIDAFSSCVNLKAIILPSKLNSIGATAFRDCSSLTIYTGFATQQSNWNSQWNVSNRPVFWNCTLSEDKTYVESLTKSENSILNPDSNNISDPHREGYTFDGWYSNTTFSGTSYTTAQLVSAPNAAYYAKWVEGEKNIGAIFLSSDLIINNIIGAALIAEGRQCNAFLYHLSTPNNLEKQSISSNNDSQLQMHDESDNQIYKETINSDFQLFSYSDFWQQRGGLTSYLDLQKDFYEAISKDYGAMRGESLIYTNSVQTERFIRHQADGYYLIERKKIFCFSSSNAEVSRCFVTSL